VLAGFHCGLPIFGLTVFEFIFTTGIPSRFSLAVVALAGAPAMFQIGTFPESYPVKTVVRIPTAGRLTTKDALTAKPSFGRSTFFRYVAG